MICARLPDHAREASRREVQTGLAQQAVQRELFGCHYGDVGAMLLEQWRLPVELQNLVRYQPEPLASPAPREPVAVLHLAHACASNPGVGEDDVEALIAGEARALIELSDADIGTALVSAREIGNEVGASIFA